MLLLFLFFPLIRLHTVLLEISESRWIWPIVENRTRITRDVNQTCSESEFNCGNATCIISYFLCDGIKDCLDGSDETAAACSNITCPYSTFRCDYGACVSKEAMCNGKVECPDGSDESGKNCGKLNITSVSKTMKDQMTKCNKISELSGECTPAINRTVIPEPISKKPMTAKSCRPDEIQCKSGLCIKRILKCDGQRNCDDGSDETAEDCSKIQCPPYTFRCDYGACVDGSSKCDNKQDCADNSDESLDVCRLSTTPDPSEIFPRFLDSNKTPGSCKIPTDTPDKYFEMICKSGVGENYCEAKPGTYIPASGSIRYGCNNGFSMSSRSNNYNNQSEQLWCVGGNWIPGIKKCKKICQKLNKNNLKITCPQNVGGKCDSVLLPGTVIKPECIDSNYRPEVPPSYSQIYCRDDGFWDRQLFTCIPVCGAKLVRVSGLIKGGEIGKAGDFPWHVAIYRKADNTLICGGTIISDHIIISAAHCFHNKATDTINSIDGYEIMVSKFTRNRTKIDNDYTKVYQIRNISLPEGSYHDATDSFINDIALLETKGKIALSPYVSPACVEWTRSRKFNPPEDYVGKVVGWGATGNGSVSEELLTGDLPYTGPVRCREKIPLWNRRFVTSDKFCAGSSNGTSVGKGDSGGGWLLPVYPYGLFTLYGIVSHDIGESNSISSFTNIIEHMEWVNSVKSAIEKRIIDEQTTIDMKNR